jgi:hypothetical protein
MFLEGYKGIMGIIRFQPKKTAQFFFATTFSNLTDFHF